ncbi:MAG: ribosome maturation factor RimP [Deltaproteobacteria bacterium]|nr:ribosome maturation factor RimP [Deltaproteobacteria bacterium]
MHKNPLLEKIAALAEPLLHSLGLALWGLEFVAGRRGVLRIYIDREARERENQGAGIDECAEASRLIGLSLDAEDLISSPYVLEVSTPGWDRLFFTPEQLAAHAGKNVEILLRAPEDGGRGKFSGVITGAEKRAEEWHFCLRSLFPSGSEPEILEFDWTEVKKARLLHIEPEKPGKSLAGKKDSRAGGKNKKSRPLSGGTTPAPAGADEA